MSGNHARSQTSASPRVAPPVFPPLSKFYCGPAQGWSSTNVSPSHNDSAWGPSSSTPDLSRTLTPKFSPATRVPSPGQWQNHLGRAYEDLQGWQSPIIPSVGALRTSVGTIDLPVEHHESTINPGWDSRPTSSAIDKTVWAGNQHQKNAASEVPSALLQQRVAPMRTDSSNSTNEQAAKRRSPSSKYSSQQYSIRASATTIDVPLFLQPQPFDPDTAPPLPDSPILNYRPQQALRDKSPNKNRSVHSRNASREDPAEALKSHRREPTRSFDHQHTRRDSRSSTSSRQRRGLLDAAALHEETYSMNPNIGPGSFATPRLPESDDGSEISRRASDQDLLRAVGHPSCTLDSDQTPKGHWDTVNSNRSGLESPFGLQSRLERRSTTATDISSNLPTTSTPESHETSNTSYRGNEIRADQTNADEDTTDSFYWHSGKSSDGEDQDDQQISRSSPRISPQDRKSDHESTSTARGNSFATTASDSRHSNRHSQASSSLQHSNDQYGDGKFGSLPTRSSSLSPNVVSYTASALGLGGPSDWEYFGDYEAEEVDDEELYAHKPRAELPTDYHRIEAPTVPPPEPPHAQQPQRSVSMRSHKATRETLESIDEQLQSSEPVETAIESGAGPGSKWSPSTTTPTTPHGDSSRPITVSSEPMPPEDHRPDLDDVIRAWSNSPYVGRTSSVKSCVTGELRSPEIDRNVGEASLASTPGEHVLGIHAFPKDAPPLPKLPDHVDLDNLTNVMDEPQNERSTTSLVTRQSVVMASDEASGTWSSEHDGQPRAQAVVTLPGPELSAGSRHGEIPNESLHEEEQDSEAVPLENTSSPPVESISTAPDASRIHLPANVPGPTLLKPLNSKDATPTETLRTASPLSEFARKRQMFETSISQKPPVVSIARKPLRTLRPSPSDQSLGGEKRVPGAILAESPLGSRSQTTSSPTSVPSIGSDRPVMSRAASGDKSVTPAIESLATHMDHSSDAIRIGGSITHSRSSTQLREPSPLEPLPSNSQELAKEGLEEDVANVRAPPPHVSEFSSEQDCSSHDPTEEMENAVTAPADFATAIQESTVHNNVRDGDNSDSEKPENNNRFSMENRNIGVEEVPAPEPEKTKIVQPPRSPSEALPIETTTDASFDVADHVKVRSSTFEELLHNEPDASTETRESPADSKHGTALANDKPRSPTRPVSVQINHANLASAMDPYADLDPWGRASLNRFAAMLREEARMESNKDKLNIFNVFTTRETRLRVVLYGTDDDLFVSNKASGSSTATIQKPQHLAKAASVKASGLRPMNNQKKIGAAKELPPLPLDRNSFIGPPTSRFGPRNAKIDSKHGTDLMIEVNDLQQSNADARSIGSPTQPNDDERENFNELKSREPAEVDAQLAPSARPRNRVNEDGEVKNYLENRRSIYRPFATQTAESMENANNFGRDIEIPIIPPTVPPLPIFESSPYIAGKIDESVEEPSFKEMKPPLDLRRFDESDFDSLVIVLPSSDMQSNEPRRLTDLRAILDAIPDDFGFIHDCVVAWDSKAKVQRELNEHARHARQIESEQRIDALFDDHEIGYGDIAELEGDFKASEAVRKADEDRWEYETFVTDVFTLVWARLTYEIDQLRPHYDHYSSLMDITVAGKDMFNSEDDLPLAPTMSAFLGIHQKLEIRYQKAFEAVLERDRRHKRVEMSPWHGLSNLDKLKRLEKQFEDAEKQAIIDYCQQRDERANRLMDVLDQNTLRGVGANQDYMEAIMKGVRRIASGRAFASLPNGGGMSQGLQVVEKAKATVAWLASSSEQIVQTFHVADMLLNNADYEVSVAKAKVAKDVGALNRLKEERTKEDQKLMRDLEHRLALIREDHRRTQDEIIKLMLFLGVQSGTVDQAAPPALGTQQTAHLQVTGGAQAEEIQTQEGQQTPGDEQAR